MTSSDGITWTKRNAGIKNTINSVIYGDGRFVAVSDNGTIHSSADGIAWTTTTLGTMGFYSIAYGLHQYVAVGGNALIIASPVEGVSTKQNAPVKKQNTALSAQFLPPDVLRISFPEAWHSPKVTVSIIDIAGNKLWNGTMVAASGEGHLDGVALPAGAYFLWIKDGRQNGCARFSVIEPACPRTW